MQTNQVLKHDTKQILKQASMQDTKKLSLQEILQMGIKIGIEAANEQYARRMVENMKQREDRRLRNTRLLLENYWVLMSHCKNGVSSNKLKPIDVLEDIDSLMDSNKELVLESIQRTKERTHIMIKHINSMLRSYQFYAKNESNEEWLYYIVMHKSYISKPRPTNEELAVEHHISVRSVRRYRNAGIEMYSRFLFGVDSFKTSNFVSQSCP
jgi:hypothetical protein